MSVNEAEERMTLGRTGIATAPLGVGTWAWGERRFWGYGGSYGQEDVAAAFAASLAAGVAFFDTAEVYGRGESERLLGALVRDSARPAIVATKYFPLPWRLRSRSVRQAFDASLARLGVARVDLYQIHQPFSPIPNGRLMDALADLVADGIVRAVGVSNYGAEHMRRAHEALAGRGVPLASNQVQYSLLDRRPERNGVLAACRELGITLIAYSPLAQGLLTGKYAPGAPRPADLRRRLPAFGEARLRQTVGLVALLRGIGEDHGGKTPAQVALNWLIRQGDVLPIPGAKTGEQAASNAGALGWALTPGEVEALRVATGG